LFHVPALRRAGGPAVTKPVYRLGAEELIELGNAGQPKLPAEARQPFFGRKSPAARLGNQLSQIAIPEPLDQLGRVSAYLSKFFSSAWAAFQRLANTPAALLQSDEGLIAN